MGKSKKALCCRCQRRRSHTGLRTVKGSLICISCRKDDEIKIQGSAVQMTPSTSSGQTGASHKDQQRRLVPHGTRQERQLDSGGVRGVISASPKKDDTPVDNKLARASNLMASCTDVGQPSCSITEAEMDSSTAIDLTGTHSEISKDKNLGYTPDVQEQQKVLRLEEESLDGDLAATECRMQDAICEVSTTEEKWKLPTDTTTPGPMSRAYVTMDVFQRKIGAMMENEKSPVELSPNSDGPAALAAHRDNDPGSQACGSSFKPGGPSHLENIAVLLRSGKGSLRGDGERHTDAKRHKAHMIRDTCADPGSSKEEHWSANNVSASTQCESNKDKSLLPPSKLRVFFHKSGTTSNGMLFEQSMYRSNRKVISTEATKFREAKEAQKASYRIIERASPVSRSEDGTSHAVRGLSNNIERQMSAHSPVPQWQNDCIQYPGGCKITLSTSGKTSHYLIEVTKQSLGLTTRSASENSRGHGLYVSEWTARFLTKTDAYKGLLCRLSFLQMVEIKLGLHNVISKAPIERCFRDSSIRERLKDYLLQYDDIRDSVKKEVADIFAKYEPGGIHYRDKRMANILYDNKTRPAAHRTQNCVNMLFRMIPSYQKYVSDKNSGFKRPSPLPENYFSKETEY